MASDTPAPKRHDDEVLEGVLTVARADPRVRAVVVSGSRADPAAPADDWRDFDIVFVVHDVAPFRADPAWIDAFGQRAILQRPDAMLGAPPRDDGGEAYLMLFLDGHRIDLTLLPVAAMATFRHDGPAVVLLDLDGAVPAPPPPDAPHHVPAPPTAAAFADVCNEFWWVAPYVAKGLARGELPYARHHLDTVLRAQLLTMLGWEVAAASGFRRGPGAWGRHLRRELPPGWWARLEATYADADPEHGWAALDAMTELFRTAASAVADRFGLAYPEDDDTRVTAHLRRMRTMGRDRLDPLVADLEAELAAWTALLAGRREREWRTPRSAGGWSVHDVVAHLAAWQQVSNARLEAAARGGDPVMPDWLDGGDPEDEERLQAYNDRILAARRDAAWATVRRAWREGFRRLIDAAAALPEADLRDPARFRWLRGQPLRAVLEGTLGHHREHRGAVADWLAAAIEPPAVGRRPRDARRPGRAAAARGRDVAASRGRDAAAGRRDATPAHRAATSSTRVAVHLRAPPSEVYRALLDATAVARWRVPAGMTGEVHVFEPWEGGAFRVSLTYRGPAGSGKTTAHTDTYAGRFVRLVPNERVVEELAFETEDPALAGIMTITTTLSAADGGTDLVAVHEGLPPGVRPADNESGWLESLGKLAALVEPPPR